MLLAEVLDVLQYRQSPHYLKTKHTHEPGISALLRAACNAGIDGVYVFQAEHKKDTTFSVQPAVYVAEAQTPVEAQAIHRHVWNLGQAPFLIIKLPTYIQVYSGLEYSKKDERVGLLEVHVALDAESLLERLADFCAASIDNGQLWRNRSRSLKTDQRVDQRLLRNLLTLEQLLRGQMHLPAEMAYALIGKYMYIRVLRDRDILSDQWLGQHAIKIDAILGRNATVHGLRQLSAVLDDRLNGDIFPLDLAHTLALTDEHVELVASLFNGDSSMAGRWRRLSLDDFQCYDFVSIPIELLASTYDQFLHAEDNGKKIGAYYTPAYLANYLISEMSSIRPLQAGMKILDPACGSGVFLTLIYTRLIEMRLARLDVVNTLPLLELVELLTSIYGIEREDDACHVAEFSLALTLLHYVDVSSIWHDEHFKLPSLRNTHIFQRDFFDVSAPGLMQDLRFDWIIGNPPWIMSDNRVEASVKEWIRINSTRRSIDNNSVAEAFSWHALDLLTATGSVGFILPAALLYNLEGWKYRQSFFKDCDVRRITNFSNLYGELFEGKVTAPVFTVIYQQAQRDQVKPWIDHYGPFALNQLARGGSKLLSITVNEDECQRIAPAEAAHGDIATWKFALWGTQRDKQTVVRLHEIFPKALAQLCKEQNNWHLLEGPQLRNQGTAGDNKSVEHVPYLTGKKQLNTNTLNKSGYLFSIPEQAREDISQAESYVRKQGGRKALLVSEPPHIIMNDAWKYSIYSDIYAVIKPWQIGLSAPPDDADHLRALSVFLSSSFVKYYFFFQVPRWGIDRDVVTLNTIKTIPVPAFTVSEIEQLAELQKELVMKELEQDSRSAQAYLDEQMVRILQVPESIATLVTEFLQLRSKLVGGGTREVVQRLQQPPDTHMLQAYAQQLTNELDDSLDSEKMHYRVTVEQSSDMICCIVDFVRSDYAFTPVVKDVSSHHESSFVGLRQELKEEFSQWIYVRRGLKIAEASSVSLYKAPQLIHWTRTQAMNDADDIIAGISSHI